MALGCHRTKSRLILGFMTPPENFQGSQAPEQLSWLMLNSRHVFDLAVVNVANIGALAISLSELEQWVRIASCLLAAVFTTCKIIESIRALRK